MPSQMGWPHGTAEKQRKKVRTQEFQELGSFPGKECLPWYIGHVSLCLFPRE